MCTPTQLSTANGCVLTSYDGFTTTYCSQVSAGNKPTVTSCYVGVFSATNGLNTAKSTACSATYEYCKMDYATSTGSCTDSCSASSTAGSEVTCCNANDCNNALMCYTGTKYTKGATNTWAKAVCAQGVNAYCKVSSNKHLLSLQIMNDKNCASILIKGAQFLVFII